MLHLLLPPTAGGIQKAIAGATQGQATPATVADIWIWAIIIMVAFFVLAIISAMLINYRPGGKDATTRKVWFWIFAILTPVTSFLVNYFHKIHNFDTIFAKLGAAKITQQVHDLTMNNVYSTIAVFAAFIVLGFLLSLIFKRSKLGTWF